MTTSGGQAQPPARCMVIIEAVHPLSLGFRIYKWYDASTNFIGLWWGLSEVTYLRSSVLCLKRVHFVLQ